MFIFDEDEHTNTFRVQKEGDYKIAVIPWNQTVKEFVKELREHFPNDFKLEEN